MLELSLALDDLSVLTGGAAREWSDHALKLGDLLGRGTGPRDGCRGRRGVGVEPGRRDREIAARGAGGGKRRPRGIRGLRGTLARQGRYRRRGCLGSIPRREDRAELLDGAEGRKEPTPDCLDDRGGERHDDLPRYHVGGAAHCALRGDVPRRQWLAGKVLAQRLAAPTPERREPGGCRPERDPELGLRNRERGRSRGGEQWRNGIQPRRTARRRDAVGGRCAPGYRCYSRREDRRRGCCGR